MYGPKEHFLAGLAFNLKSILAAIYCLSAVFRL